MKRGAKSLVNQSCDRESPREMFTREKEKKEGHHDAPQISRPHHACDGCFCRPRLLPCIRYPIARNMSDDDLYDDLANTKVTAATAVSKKPSSSLTNVIRPKNLSDEVDALQQRVAALEKENETLRRNMGTLYRTAKAELGRKDTAIENLRGELEKANGTRR